MNSCARPPAQVCVRSPSPPLAASSTLCAPACAGVGTVPVFPSYLCAPVRAGMRPVSVPCPLSMRARLRRCGHGPSLPVLSMRARTRGYAPGLSPLPFVYARPPAQVWARSQSSRLIYARPYARVCARSQSPALCLCAPACAGVGTVPVFPSYLCAPVRAGMRSGPVPCPLSMCVRPRRCGHDPSFPPPCLCALVRAGVGAIPVSPLVYARSYARVCARAQSPALTAPQSVAPRPDSACPLLVKS